MNELNVVALEQILAELLANPRDARTFAEFLAARGVLVPSAIKPSEEHGFVHCPACTIAFERGETTAEVIERLERIAKGET